MSSDEKKGDAKLWYCPGIEGPEAKLGQWVRYQIISKDGSQRSFDVYNIETRFGTREQLIRGHLTDLLAENPEFTVSWQVLGKGDFQSNYAELKNLLTYYLLGLD